MAMNMSPMGKGRKKKIAQFKVSNGLWILGIVNAILMGILLLFRKVKWKPRLMQLYALGRMGLTTYLMQTLFGFSTHPVDNFVRNSLAMPRNAGPAGERLFDKKAPDRDWSPTGAKQRTRKAVQPHERLSWAGRYGLYRLRKNAGPGEKVFFTARLKSCPDTKPSFSAACF